MSVITIRGQMGSGAPEIGQILAEKLGYRYLDQEILSEVALRVERSEECIAGKEMPAGSLPGKIYESINNTFPVGMAREGAYVPGWEFPLEDKMYISALKAVVHAAALQDNTVIRGRGSQFILKDYPGVFHILTVAPLGMRVRRLAAAYRDDVDAAHQAIKRFDGSRRQFIKRYFGADIEDPVHYNLVINTGTLSNTAAAELAIFSLKNQQHRQLFVN